MRSAAILPLLLLAFGLFGQDLNEVRLSVDFTDTPLSDAISHLEKKFDFNFSFPNAVIEASTANCRFEAADWAEIEQCLFGANELRATAHGDGYISLKPLSVGNKRSWTLRFNVLNPEGEALPFAPVQFSSGSVTTDEDGAYAGQVTAAATDIVYLTYLGYESREVLVRDLVTNGGETVTLKPTAIDLSSVLVSEYLSDGIGAPEDGSFIRIKPNRAPTVPGFANGEVYRALSLLPGISNTDETAGELNIRGGSADQNLVLWDGIPVYSSGHFFGMISPFSPALIDEVNVWRGGPDAAFGGRVGGMVEINTDRSVVETFSAGAGLSLLIADAFVKAPLVKGKSDVQLALRASPKFFSEGPAYNAYRAQVFQGDVFSRILEAEARDLPQEEDFNFGELNGRWRYNFGAGRALAVSGFTQHDDFGYRIGTKSGDRFFIDGLVTKNDGVSGNYAQPLGNGQLSFQFAHSAFSEKGGSGFRQGTGGISGQQGSEIQERSVRLEYDIAAFAEGELKVGVQAQRFEYELSYAIENTLADSLGEFSFNDKANALAAYGNYRWGEEGPLSVEVGLRLQHYEPTQKLYPEPRLRVGYWLAEDWLLKAAYAENHQFTQEIVNLNPQRISATVSLWTLADDGRLPVAAGREGSLGLSGEAGDWFFDAEIYHKKVKGITTLNSLLLQQEGLAMGNSSASGLDLLVKRRWANWRSWAIYTLSNTEWQFPDLGQYYFPADNDRRHQLQLVHTYTNKGWSASAGWQVHSGARYTKSEEVETQLRNNRLVTRLETGPTNGGRLPAFHRLDVSVFRDFAPAGKRWNGRVGLSILNLYGRENILERRYLVVESSRLTPNLFELEELNRLGLGFTPNLSLRVGFK